LQDLGRLAATWSQIEFIIANLISRVTRTELGSACMFLAGMSAKARIDCLRGLIGRMPSAQCQEQTRAACDRLSDLTERRDHLALGTWGLFVDRKTMTPHPACFYPPSKDQPIFATELRKLCDEAAAESRRLGGVLALVVPELVSGPPPRRFFFSDGPPAPGWNPD
jgi:hypothetical protein